MPKIHPIQHAFTAGELSPLMWGRSDTEGYRQGLQTMNNLIADARGPAKSRFGMRFTSRYAGNDARIKALSLSTGQAVLLVFMDQIAYIQSFGGSIPSEELVTNSRFFNGSTGWTNYIDGLGSTVTYQNGFVELATVAGGDTRYAGVGQQITISNQTAEHTLRVECLDGLTRQIRIGNAIGDGSILTTSSANLIDEFTFTPNAATVWITVFSSNQDNNTATTRVSAISCFETASSQTSFTTPWPADALQELHFAQSPGTNTIYITHPNYQTRKFVFDPSAGTWSFDPVTFTAAPANWAGSNWPRTCTFYQGRLWLAGSPQEPENVWASKTNTPEDLTTGSTATDGLRFVLEQFGTIRWMVGTKELVVGTENAEYIIIANQGVIVPNDIQIQRQSAFGSAPIQPPQVADQLMFVTADTRRVRAMQYNRDTDNWRANDVSFISEHITNSGIRDMSFQQNPDNVLWSVLNNGTLIGMTYERSQDSYGWHRHDTQGNIKNISVGRAFNRDLLAIAVQRVDGNIDIDVIVPGEVTQVFMDSWIDRVYPSPVTTVDGLDHLEGKEVQVVTDGAIHPNRTVASGQITLQSAATSIQVGLQFTPRMQTLHMDMLGDAGSAMSYQKHWAKIYVKLLNSAKPIVNGKRLPTRFPATPMNTREPDRTEDIKVAALGRTPQAYVIIEQDLPLNLIVTAIYGELRQESLE